VTIAEVKDWFADLGKYLLIGGAAMVGFAGLVFVIRNVAERRRTAVPSGPSGNPYAPQRLQALKESVARVGVVPPGGFP